MSAVIELVPPILISVEDRWLQPLDSVVDVSAYTDAVVMLTITQFQRGDMTTAFRIYLQTALENYDERYVRLKELAAFDADITDQQVWQFTFTGPGETSSETPSDDFPGFGRFLRIEAEAGAWSETPPTLMFDVKTLLRAR